MKDKVRVSFDVPVEEHTFIKSKCVKSRIAFKELMQEIFHKTYTEMKKNELHHMILKGFEDSYAGKTTRLTQEDLEKWEKMLDD